MSKESIIRSFWFEWVGVVVDDDDCKLKMLFSWSVDDESLLTLLITVLERWRVIGLLMNLAALLFCFFLYILVRFFEGEKLLSLNSL